MYAMTDPDFDFRRVFVGVAASVAVTVLITWGFIAAALVQ